VTVSLPVTVQGSLSMELGQLSTASGEQAFERERESKRERKKEKDPQSVHNDTNLQTSHCEHVLYYLLVPVKSVSQQHISYRLEWYGGYLFLGLHSDSFITA